MRESYYWTVGLWSIFVGSITIRAALQAAYQAIADGKGGCKALGLCVGGGVLARLEL